MQSHFTPSSVVLSLALLFITLSSNQLSHGMNLPVIEEGEENIISGKPSLLGQVEKKTYYVSSRETKLNWSDAKTLCEQSGMSLGTIETPNEQQFLRQMSHHIGNPNQGYWIGARNVLAATQFVWDTSPETLVQDVGQTWDFNTPPHTAIVFWSTLKDTFNGRWFAVETALTFRVICEMT